MPIIMLITFISLFLVAGTVVKDKLSKIVIFANIGWWAMSLMVSVFNFNGLYPVSDYTYFLLILNVIMLTLGFLVAGQGKEQTERQTDFSTLFHTFEKRIYSGKAFIICSIILTIVLFSVYIKFQALLVKFGPAEARNLRYYTGGLFANTFQMLMYNYFAEGFCSLLAVIVAYSLILGRIRSWMFAWSVLNLLLYGGIGAGRILFFEMTIMLIFFAVAQSIIQPKTIRSTESPTISVSSIPKRKKLFFVLLFSVGLIAILSVYLTAMRIDAITASSELAEMALEAFLDNTQTYFVGAFRALDYAIQNPINYGFNLGRLTFGAVDETICYGVKLLGGNFVSVNSQINTTLAVPIIIGSGSSDFNALYTSVFRYYFDLGLMGVIVFPFMLGAVMRRIVIKFNRFPCVSSLILMVFLFVKCLFTTQNWFFQSPGTGLLIVFLLLLYRHERRAHGRTLANNEVLG